MIMIFKENLEEQKRVYPSFLCMEKAYDVVKKEGTVEC